MKNINEMDSHVNQNESSNQVSGKVRRSFRRFIRVAIVLLLLVGGAFFYVRYYFVFGSAVLPLLIGVILRLWVGCKSRHFELCRKKRICIQNL